MYFFNNNLFQNNLLKDEDLAELADLTNSDLKTILKSPEMFQNSSSFNILLETGEIQLSESE